MLHDFSSAFQVRSCQSDLLWPIANLTIIGLQRLFVFKFPSYQDRKRWAFSNIIFRTVELRFVCNNHAIQSSLLFHLTIFLSTGDFFLKIEFLLLPQRWVASCLCLCWHNAAGNSQMGSFLQPNLPQWISMSFFWRCQLLLTAMHCITIICLTIICLLLESSRKT